MVEIRILTKKRPISFSATSHLLFSVSLKQMHSKTAVAVN